MEKNNEDCDDLQALQVKLNKKLEELSDIVRVKASKVKIEKETGSQNSQLLQSESKISQEQDVIDKLKVLSILPDWLNSLHQSIDEFVEIAKSLQLEIPKVGETPLGESPFDSVTHTKQRAKYQELLEQQVDNAWQWLNTESASAVNSMVDMAIEIGDSRKVNQGIISDKVKAECSLLFEKSLPINSITECIENLLDEEFVRNVSPQDLRQEVYRHYTLNKVELEKYLASRASDHVVGHIVHRLLGSKYPRPAPPQGLDLPRMPVMALLLGLQDAEAMGNLHDALVQQDVTLVLFEDALEFCIEVYRIEGPGIPLLESRDPPVPMEEPLQVDIIEQLLPHTLLAERIQGRPEPTHHERETQTGPEVSPVLSRPASLGKQALEVLRVSQTLSDWLMIAMLIEYLKHISKPGQGGWVLADFPNTFKQISLFETAISGHHVPNPDLKCEEENLSGVTLHQSQIVCDPSVPPGFLEPFTSVFTSVVSVLDTEPPQDLNMLEYVSLVQEVYIKQDIHHCFHCIKWNTDNIASLTKVLLCEPPHQVSNNLNSVIRSDYEYADMNIPHNFAVGLASVWETLETAYLASLHRVFLTRRAREKGVAYFIINMRSEFGDFLARADTMQQIVDEWQARHKELPHTKLSDLDVKAELRTWVQNLQKCLSDVAKARHEEAKIELERVAGEPWLNRELGERLNIISSLVQLELDRYVDTIALLQDYFCASLERMPPDSSKSLRFDVPKALTAEVTDDWATAMVTILINVNEPNAIPEAHTTYVANLLEAAKLHIQKLSSTVGTSITKLESEFKPKPAASKKKQVVAKTKGKKKEADLSNIPPLEDNEANKLTSLCLQLLQEWRMACETETEKTIIRLQETCDMAGLEAMELVQHVWTNAFSPARTAADAQLKSDEHSSSTLCQFLDMAVEAEARLENDLKFPRKITYWNNLLAVGSSCVSLPYDPDLSHRLQGLVDIFQRVAPEGVIQQAALIYILQQAAASDNCLLPAEWSSLDSEKISQLVQQVVTSERTDWRSFLLKLLDLPVATQRQLLLAKKILKFSDPMNRGLVAKENFSQARLWIEEAFKNEVALENVHNLLFELYRIPGKEQTNYLDMLLACSYDPDPILGFVKACAVFSGSVICTGLDAVDKGDSEMDLLLKEMNSGFLVSDVISLEVAKAVIESSRPFNEEESVELQETLQIVFQEAEEQSLSPEQRRARQREAVANKGGLQQRPVTVVLASFLVKHPRIADLASPFKSIHFPILMQHLNTLHLLPQN